MDGVMRLTNTRLVAAAAVLFQLAVPLSAEGQPGGHLYRVGLLAGGSVGATAFVRAAVLAGLEELGYREGQTIVVVERYADGKFERLPALASELVALRVDVILTSTTPATLAAQRATSTIPIVVVTSGDLLGAGVVSSLARPGSNVTGLSFLGTELAVKQMEILKQLAPTIRRFAFLANGAIQPEVLFFKAMEHSAPKLGVNVRFVDATAPSDYEVAFARMVREGVEGLVVAPNLINLENRTAIVELAGKARLPAVYQGREFPEAGGLISYGINRPQFFRRAAIYVDKIVKGVKPGDLPIEQPTQFELVINVKTAKTLGLSIPPSLRLQAETLE
jgi:putative tryptophan/tyrosine transport system substrate-binding protein